MHFFFFFCCEIIYNIMVNVATGDFCTRPQQTLDSPLILYLCCSVSVQVRVSRYSTISPGLVPAPGLSWLQEHFPEDWINIWESCLRSSLISKTSWTSPTTHCWPRLLNSYITLKSLLGFTGLRWTSELLDPTDVFPWLQLLYSNSDPLCVMTQL